MGQVLSSQHDSNKALETYKEVFSIQKFVLGTNHLGTLNTQQNMANLLLSQGKSISALKDFREC